MSFIHFSVGGVTWEGKNDVKLDGTNILKYMLILTGAEMHTRIYLPLSGETVTKRN